MIYKIQASRKSREETGNFFPPTTFVRCFSTKRKTFFFRLHKQFFSVIDWQKVESGFQAFQKNWNLFFLSMPLRALLAVYRCGCCFVKVLFLPFTPPPFYNFGPSRVLIFYTLWLFVAELFFHVRARTNSLISATMKPEGWNIYKKLCKRRFFFGFMQRGGKKRRTKNTHFQQVERLRIEFSVLSRWLWWAGLVGIWRMDYWGK